MFFEKLPVWQKRKEIVSAIKNNDIVILRGETGSGKTTVVPYLLQQEGYLCLVTQPRRLAAESVASFMASELGEEVGETVGFWHGLKHSFSKETEILFTTDGLEVVLEVGKELEQGGFFQNKEYILLIDEIHEWNKNIETLIAIVKERRDAGQKMKVVLMSATLENEELQDFFEGEAACIHVPGRTFPVTYHHEEDGKEWDIIQEQVNKGKNVLFFQPGKAEIYRAIEMLKGLNAEILPLHADLMSAEQQLCFKSYNRPKVIVSTNLAQTSVTVPDIDVVVDTGTARILDVDHGIEGLHLRDISKADCIQRMGRAGRTHEGEYYLCSDRSLDVRAEFSIPEIQRSLLDQFVLRLLSINKDPEHLSFVHQPNREEIHLAKKVLECMGAIKEQMVTPLGKKIATMPLSTRNARMILRANELGVTSDVITIASIMEVGSLVHHKKGSYATFTNESKSDLLAELEIWKQLEKMGWIDFEKIPVNAKNFFRIKETRNHLLNSLKKLDLTFESSGDRDKILEACLSGMMDEIFISFGYRGDYESLDGEPFRLARNSCVNTDASRFVFGVPRTIQTKDFWGFEGTMKLISMASSISMETVRNFYPEYFSEEEKNVFYSPENDCCVACYNIYWRKWTYVTEYTKEVQNHPRYEELKKCWEAEEERKRSNEARWILYEEEFRKRVEDNRRQREDAIKNRITMLSLDGFDIPISYSYGDWKGTKPYVTLSNYQLFYSLKNEKQLVLENGRKVEVTCDGYSSASLDEIRNRIVSSWRARVWDEAKRYASKNVSTKRSVILGWKDKVGEKELDRYCNGEVVVAYYYIHYEDGTFSLKVSDQNHDTETKEALKELFKRELKVLMSEKKFMIVGSQGKKILTKKGKEAMHELNQYIAAYAEEISFENFEESIKEFTEIYQEMLAEVTAS